MLRRIAGHESVGLVLAIVAASAFAACSNDDTTLPREAPRADASGDGAPAHDSGRPEAGSADEAGGGDASQASDARGDSSSNDASENEEEEGGVDALVAVDAWVPQDASANPPLDAGGSLDGSGDVSSSDGSVGVDCSSDAGGLIGSSGAPFDLACTGLYADWSSGAIAPGVLPFDPGIFLWADGAAKSRYIYLPPGTTIDTSNMDEWTFPVGTKIWKAFALNGLNVETRYLYKTVTGWVWTTYQWSVDQTTATELTTGAANVNGTTYQIPTHTDCQTCHQGRIDFVLGFEAIGLSTPMATGLTMSALVQSGQLTNPPSAPLVIPGDATASAALGWLHANCGNACHNGGPNSLAEWTGFQMRLSASGLSTVEGTTTYQTGVNVPAGYTLPDGGMLTLIAAGDPANSCVTIRDGHRDTQGEGIQMPPLDTHVVDTAGVQLVASWISSL